MIRVHRPLGLSPLNPRLVAQIEAAARMFYAPSSAPSGQRRFDPKERVAISQQARKALIMVFSGKCAYCESNVVTTAPGDVDRFRPIYDATQISGEGSPDHYGWLLAEWENLYLACPACSRAKKSLFPVMGHRAPVLAPLPEIRRLEVTQLIDPCYDDPEDHLNFVGSGFVEAMTTMGEVSIKVLNLNRPPLIEARRRVWERVLLMLRTGRDEDVQADMGPAAEYAATARAAFNSIRGGTGSPRRSVHVSSAPEDSAEAILAGNDEAFRLTARPLMRVRISNMRAIRHADIRFGEPGSEQAPWLALLGENASGKSTVLQGIALALAGAVEARRHVRPSSLVSADASEGSVEVWFWDQEKPVELHFRRGRDQFTGTLGPSAIVLGYGALRYAERRTRRWDDELRFSRIAPLMQPIAKIRYPGQWLASQKGTYFETATRTLLGILPEGAAAVVHRQSNDRIYFELNGHRASLAELSAGYQAIVGMCADIMRLLFERWDTLTSATAIVLIDEIDAHLHPRWAMRIVTALREAFPQVQFITSTHNPLALRGLRNGEVALLRRDDANQVMVDQDLPRIEGLWVDQLLTSRVFGLASTIDPATEQLLDEYYHLRSLPHDSDHARRMAEIREQIGDRESLGRSESERLMLEAADAFVQAVDEEDRNAPALRQETLRHLAEIAAGGARRAG